MTTNSNQKLTPELIQDLKMLVEDFHFPTLTQDELNNQLDELNNQLEEHELWEETQGAEGKQIDVLKWFNYAARGKRFMDKRKLSDE